MIRVRHLSLVATACAAALLLASCGGGSGDGGGASSGEPVAGGTLRAIHLSEPRSLDPVSLGNAYAVQGLLGNALYGTLLVDNPKSGELEPRMAEGFTTDDGGATFELSLREGLTFTDGSPLDAEAVKINWERHAEPDSGSSYTEEAAMMTGIEVVDPTTLKVTLDEPLPSYGHVIMSTSLNWIASPTALEAGQQSFDKNPVGAGPFTLKEWIRQGSIQLQKNPDYWDAPKPYVDALTLRASSDAPQRVNSLISGDADVVTESNWTNLAKAEEAGYSTEVLPLNGGVTVAMNTRRAPFDDVRARQALALALDLNAVNDSVYQGKGRVVDTMFTKSSPYYSDVTLAGHDRAEAQRLFDELAAEGKPVSFTFTSLPSAENKATGESIQAQLSSYRNAEAKVKTVDLSTFVAVNNKRDFDMVVASGFFAEPEPRLSALFDGESALNLTGIDDKALNEALAKGSTSTDDADRKAAYQTVQERLAELRPVIFTTRAAPSVMTGKNVHGVAMYGYGSLLPEELWLDQ